MFGLKCIIPRINVKIIKIPFCHTHIFDLKSYIHTSSDFSEKNSTKRYFKIPHFYSDFGPSSHFFLLLLLVFFIFNFSFYFNLFPSFFILFLFIFPFLLFCYLFIILLENSPKMSKKSNESKIKMSGSVKKILFSTPQS